MSMRSVALISTWLKPLSRSLPAILVACCLVSPRHSAGQTNAYGETEALVRNHQWDEGLALVLPLVKQEPRNAKALNLAGLALTGKGDIQQANEYFKKAILASPGFAPALKNLAVNEFNQKQYAKSEDHFLSAQKELPGDPVVHL